MTFKMDLSAFERKARELNLAAAELPFAVANAMTTAANRVKDVLVDDVWPGHVKVKNPRFMRLALRVEGAKARDFRQNSSMGVAIHNDTPVGRHVGLKRLETGGSKTAQSGKLAIPTARVRRTAGGAVVKSQKPRALKRAVVKGGLIFQVEGSGKNSRLRLMYKLQPSARIKPQVPFTAEFQSRMRAETFKALPEAIGKVLTRYSRTSRR